MFRNKSVNVHQFSMVPRADIPRSSFRIQKSHKTAFDASYLIPIYVNEVLPGDSFNLRMTAFCRLATPTFPFMDNLHLESFFFFVPNRLVWTNWVKFMGEQVDPGDSISFVIPQVVSPAAGYDTGTLQDYMGLPTAGQVTGGAISHNALPLRAYNLIFNTWFRDENLIGSATVNAGSDGPDLAASYVLKKRGKRHDYFTSALPWPQKGNTPVSLPLGTTAPVISDPAGGGVPSFYRSTGAPGTDVRQLHMQNAANPVLWAPTGTPPTGAGSAAWSTTALVADLSAATAATINQIRQAFQIQKLLERDARGGTRYTEIIRAHFGVVSPDARLQRPEYLGGGSTPVSITPVSQTSGTELSESPMGTLSAFGTALAHGHGFSQSFTEHGYVIGLVMVRADLSYNQGVRKMWYRSTRYDFYFPAFAMLGEQAVLNREIYADGSATDDDVFGYQERWAEYRYDPSMITSFMRTTAPGTIANWHLAEDFATLPTLNGTFIADNSNGPVERVTAVGNAANGQQFLFDGFFDLKAARPMPVYSVPGMIDRF